VQRCVLLTLLPLQPKQYSDRYPGAPGRSAGRSWTEHIDVSTQQRMHHVEPPSLLFRRRPQDLRQQTARTTNSVGFALMASVTSRSPVAAPAS
jgi:hypothetical protein